MNSHITQALACLQNANYAGYFEEMDKVAVPDHLKPLFAELKSKFMQGLRTFEFSQQLQVFAKEIDKTLSNHDASQAKQGEEKPTANQQKGNRIITNNAEKIYNIENLENGNFN